MDDLKRFFIGKAIMLKNNEIIMVLDKVNGNNDLLVEMNGAEMITDVHNMIESMSTDSIAYHQFLEMFPEHSI